MKDGFTPLIAAIDTSNLSLVKLVLEYKPFIEVIICLL
jgi:hypothetical protein